MSSACAVSSVWSGPLGRNWAIAQPGPAGTSAAVMARALRPRTELQSWSNWRAAAAATLPCRSKERSCQASGCLSLPEKYSPARLRPPDHSQRSSAMVSLRWLRRLRGPMRRRLKKGRNTATSPPAARSRSK
ncbi:hypothetical protein D3C72_1814260 [compost metagenome]